ncbi:MAG TPA: phospholipase [Burkholderiaceae bacterium]|nr:phospholipase [Burkholderiaceae bacterium]
MNFALTKLIELPALPLAHRIRAPRDGKVEGSPCLLLLHGVGANELGLANIAELVDPRLTVILVRAPLVFGPMQFGFFRVNFTASGPVINAEQAEQARQMLTTFIESLPSVYGIDGRQVWLAGFSQGGILSASVGLTRPDLVRGFGILSGRILPEISSRIASPHQLAELHTFISHGLHDEKLGVNYARSAHALLLEKGVVPTYREYTGGHELNAAMRDAFNQWLSEQLS